MPKMKVAKTNTDEILSLMRLLNEVEMLHKDLRLYNLDSIEWDEYDELSKMGQCDDDGEFNAERFVEDLARAFSNIHFQRILMNCDVLLQHCAHPDETTLEYNPNIAKGLELLQAWVNEKPGRRLEFPVQRVAHASLDRIGDSVHTSQCPECTPGVLLMRRTDEAPHHLLPEDICTYCGQRYVYTDVRDAVIATPETA